MWKIIFVLALPFGCSVPDSTIGDSCDYYDFECNGRETEEVCEDGYCQCRQDIEPHYSSANGPQILGCNVSSHNQGVLKSPRCNSSSCGVNSLCQRRKTYIGFSSNIEKDICVCKEGFLRVDDECREVVYQKVLWPCYIQEEGPVHWCNAKEHSYCENGTCICFESYFGNTTSGKCEPMANYKKAYWMSEYLAKKGHYCRRDRDCSRFPTLFCENYKCNDRPLRGTPYDTSREDNKSDGNAGRFVVIGIIFGFAVALKLCMCCWSKILNEDPEKVAETVDRLQSQQNHYVKRYRRLHRSRIQTVSGSMTSLPIAPSAPPNSAGLLPSNHNQFQPAAPPLPPPPRESVDPPPYEATRSPPPPYEEICLISELHRSTVNTYQSANKISSDLHLGESQLDDTQKRSQTRTEALAKYLSNAVEPENDEIVDQSSIASPTGATKISSTGTTEISSSGTSPTGTTARSSALSRTSHVTLSTTSELSSEGPTKVSI